MTAQQEVPERFRSGLVGQEETDRRLTHDLCVWCARRLPDFGGSDMFCRSEHQSAWHEANNGRPLEPSPAEWEAPLRGYHRQGRAALLPGAPLPPGWDYSTGPDRTVWATRLEEQPGTRIVHPAGTGGGGFALGLQSAPGEARLWEIEAEPEPEREFPTDALRTMELHGWDLGLDHLQDPQTADAPPYSPVITCPRCSGVMKPVLITGYWPSASQPEAATPPRERRGMQSLVHEGTTYEFSMIPGTRVCCSMCELPLPGTRSSIVPIYRMAGHNPAAGWMDVASFGWVHPDGRYAAATITEDTVRNLTVGDRVVQRAWREALEKLTVESNPWHCALPGCTQKALHWVALAAPLLWQGYTWEPRDHQPIRWGMCPAHHHDLLGQALATYHNHTRSPYATINGKLTNRIRLT